MLEADNIRELIKAAEADLVKVRDQKAEIEKRREELTHQESRLRKLIESLRSFIPGDASSGAPSTRNKTEAGGSPEAQGKTVAQAVEDVLKAAGAPLHVSDIQDRVNRVRSGQVNRQHISTTLSSNDRFETAKPRGYWRLKKGE